MKVNVKAEVDLFDWDNEECESRLERAIIDQAAKQVRQEYRGEIEREMRSQVQAAVSAEIATVMNALFTPTDVYGQPKGERTTMREMVAQTTHEFFTKKITKEGRPTAFARSGEKTMTAIEWLAHEAATNVLADATKAAQEELRQQVRDGMSVTIADVATKVLGLK